MIRRMEKIGMEVDLENILKMYIIFWHINNRD